MNTSNHRPPKWLEPLHVPDRVFVVLAILFGLITIAVEIWAWPILPVRMPQHLNVLGQVDAYVQKNIWTVFGISGLNILIGGLMAFAYRHPEYHHYPMLVPLSTLPKEQRGMVSFAVRHLLTMVGVWVTLLLSSIALNFTLLGLGIQLPMLTVMMYGLVGMVLVTIGGYTLLLSNWIRRQA